MAYAVELVGQETSEGENATGRQRWSVSGTESATIARALAWASAPVVFDGLLKQRAQLRELGGGEWEAEVFFGLTGQSGDANDISWSFEISKQSLHITHSVAHVESYVASGTAPDHKGAIGVRSDGNGQSVDGCDVSVPVFTWQEVHNVPAALVASYAWLQIMEGLVATINNAAFRIWGEGELLLLGVAGQHAKLAEKNVPITFRFASSKTKTGMTIGDITGVTKQGHDYLWVEYEQAEDATAIALTSRPKAVHVERVYDYGNFSQLGIGDPWS